MAKLKEMQGTELQQGEGFPIGGLQTLDTTEYVSDYSEIKFILRTVGVSPRGAEVVTVTQVENYINSFLKDGWRIYQFSVLESLPEGRRMSWLLVR